MFQLYPQFTPSSGFSLDTLDTNINPYPVQTVRERIYLLKGEPIYRMMYEKTSELELDIDSC